MSGEWSFSAGSVFEGRWTQSSEREEGEGRGERRGVAHEAEGLRLLLAISFTRAAYAVSIWFTTA
jgi:hypothetical protein